MTYIEMAQAHVAELYPTIVYGNPRIMDLPPGAIIGTWAYSVPGKVRFILDKSLEVATGTLPADLSRAWIRDAYPLPFRRRKNQMQPSFKAPLHAIRGQHGDCVYLDISGAYLRVLRLGYDVEYILKRYVGAAPRPVPSEVANNKFSYSIAVAMSGPKLSSLQVMGKNGLFDHKPMNLYSNPCLFNLAQDVLNGCASDVLASLGSDCVYVNTDGFIVKRAAADTTRRILEDWGFHSGEKAQGPTLVYGVASWTVGDKSTKRRDPQAQNFTGPLMDKEARQWLKKTFSTWQAKIGE